MQDDWWGEPSNSPTVHIAESPLSNSQEIILILLGLFSSILSILGSTTIVYKVITKGRGRSPYDRLMLGLSTCDIIASFTLALGPFLMPATLSHRVWAIGNDTTCSIMGWFFQFSWAAVFYNGMLSYYYLFTVRFGVKREAFARKYEIWMHAVTWVWFVGSATYGAAIGLYHEFELGYGCWVNDFPENCEVIDPDSCVSYLYGYVMAALPSAFVLVSIVVNNIVIVLYVRKELAPERDFHDERMQLHAAHIREVATQGYLYVGTFLLCTWSTTVVRILESVGFTYKDEGDLYVFLVFNAFLQPLQGFLNVLVYNKPNYLRVRKAFPSISMFQAMYLTVLSSDIPTLAETTTNENSKISMNTSKRALPSKPGPAVRPINEAEIEGEAGVSKEAVSQKQIKDPGDFNQMMEVGLRAKGSNATTPLGRRFGNLHFGASNSRSKSDEENGSAPLADEALLLCTPCGEGEGNETETPRGRTSIRNSASTAATLKMSNQGIAPARNSITTQSPQPASSLPYSPWPNNIPSSLELAISVSQEESDKPLSSNEFNDPAVLDPSDGALTTITHQEDSTSGNDGFSDEPSLSQRSSRVAMDGSIESNSL